MAVVNIKEIQRGKEIELPGFYGEGDFITVLAKRPSILSLAAKGVIPNSLLAAAQKVFAEQVDGSVSFSEIGEVMETVAKAALIEPTYDDFKEAGIELTDDQIAYLFSFVQGGVKALESFRNEQSGVKNNKPSKKL